MDTFSPPFEPQNPPTSQPAQTATPPMSAPVQTQAPMTQAKAPNSSWMFLLILGLLLFLGGVAGYLYLWLTPTL